VLLLLVVVVVVVQGITIGFTLNHHPRSSSSFPASIIPSSAPRSRPRPRLDILPHDVLGMEQELIETERIGG
jgi:hypothetical protein